MKKPVFILKFLFGFILALAIVQVVVSSRLSTTGITLGKLDDTIQEYRKENRQLSEKLLLTSSYTEIASHAAQLGFVNSRPHIFLTSPLPLAARQ